MLANQIMEHEVDRPVELEGLQLPFLSWRPKARVSRDAVAADGVGASLSEAIYTSAYVPKATYASEATWRLRAEAQLSIA